MITEHDLQEAIAECKGVRNPNASTCIKLAAFLTIQREMYGTERIPEAIPQYSFDSGDNVVDFYSESDFSRLIDGRKQEDVWPIIDELMTTLQAIQPRLYNAVIRKLQA